MRTRFVHLSFGLNVQVADVGSLRPVAFQGRAAALLEIPVFERVCPALLPQDPLSRAPPKAFVLSSGLNISSRKPTVGLPDFNNL
ncbi:hypothetical protein K1718_09245 [Roseibium porphyridii]|uniref:Uncharacterized protein n=1 Tax=Roseibium porphyridii TaxID=2866279 RepID=A0ABY8F7V7_9HYPH|nr:MULTISPECIES: hypothetical protein [Stappiaceae]WFE91526.1 hypothetical protein K1718_09245 [Roseibium sp. KMA01]